SIDRTVAVTITGTNDAPVAVADTASATEAGGVSNATPGVDPTGNVLTNDTDVDSGDTKTVTAVAVSGGASGTLGSGLAGSYGTLILNANGSYSYVVDNANATVEALDVGGTLTDTFTYTMRDAAGLTSSSTLTVTIHGAADSAPPTLAPGLTSFTKCMIAGSVHEITATDADPVMFITFEANFDPSNNGNLTNVSAITTQYAGYVHVLSGTGYSQVIFVGNLDESGHPINNILDAGYMTHSFYFNDDTSANNYNSHITFTAGASESFYVITGNFNGGLSNVVPVDSNVSDPPLAPVTEDTSAIPGESLSNLFAPITLGQIVVLGNSASETQGHWQYSLDQGANWIGIGSNISVASALVLSSLDILRFQPLQNWNGIAGSLLVGLPTTDLGTHGSTLDVSLADWLPGLTLDLISTSVTAVNDAPIALGDAALAPVATADANPLGATVGDLLSHSFSDAADAVAGGSAAATLAGIAIIGNGAAADQGGWQYSTDHGHSWSAIGAGLSDATALVLAATDELRFVSSGHFDGTPGGLTVRLIESGGDPVVGGHPIDLSGADAIGGHSHVSADAVLVTADVYALPGLGSDQALAFNGASHVEVASTPALTPTQALTLESWIQLTGPAAGGTIVSDLSGQAGFRLWFNDSSGQLEFDIGDGSAVRSVAGDASALADGGWHHVAANYDGSALHLLIDGTGIAEASGIGGGALGQSAAALSIGNGLTGALNELSLWSSARSQSEIAGDLSHTLGGHETGLAGDWHFDGSLANSAASAGGAAGTLAGAAHYLDLADSLRPSLNATAYKGMILGSDAAGDTLSYAVATDGAPAHGTVTFSGNAFTYTPTSGHISGDDSFMVAISDGHHAAVSHEITLHPV
ncbi:MAG: LamG-like jellyroll fold domain-containing protein, partial [Rhodospirillaceae bacterium]